MPRYALPEISAARVRNAPDACAVGSPGGQSRHSPMQEIALANYREELDRLYQDVLLRPVDPSGYRTYSRLLESGEKTLAGIEAILRDSDEYRRLAYASGEPRYDVPHRSPRAVAEAVADHVRGKVVCDLGCGEGDMLASLAPNAAGLVGMESSPLRAQQARGRGFEVVEGDYWRDPLPAADVYYVWPTDGSADVDFLVSRLLDEDHFDGLIIVAGDAAIALEQVAVRRVGRFGSIRAVGYDEGTGERQKGIFLLAIVGAGQLRAAGRDRRGRERRVLASLAVGDGVRQLAAVTVPALEQYADDIGADLCVISRPAVQGASIFHEVFQLERVFEYYDRVMYIDLDVLVRHESPDLFDLVPDSALGVFIESRFQTRALADFYNQSADYRDSTVGIPEDCFNNGVMVMSRRHRSLFRLPESEAERAIESDQSIMIARAARHGFPVFDIGHSFNYMVAMMAEESRAERAGAWMIHYGSIPMPLKIEQAREEGRTRSAGARQASTLPAAGRRVFRGMVLVLAGTSDDDETAGREPQLEAIAGYCAEPITLTELAAKYAADHGDSGEQALEAVSREVERLLAAGVLVCPNQYWPGPGHA